MILVRGKDDMDSVLPMYAFLLLASLTEVMKIFMRGPSVSKSPTTSVPN